MKTMSVVALAVCACLVALPSEAKTGKGLSQADVDKINQVTQTFVKAALAKDWATVAGLYLEDAVVNLPNEPAIQGRAAIQTWLEKFPPITAFKAGNVKVEGRDDLAYVLGTYAMTIAPPGAPGPVEDSGKYVEIRRRQPDGQWLIAVDIFNSDLPTAPPQVDMAAAEQVIRSLTTEWFAAEKRRDMEASLSYLAPDAVVQPEGAPAIQGVEAMRALYKEWFAIPFTDLVMEPRLIVVASSGDLAYDIGSWKIVTETEGAKAEEVGKSTIIWKKLNGQWKAAVMSCSMDTPPAPAPKEAK